MDRNYPTNTSTTSSDSLLPGKGHTPNYGITDSNDAYLTSIKPKESNPQRWYVVALCTISACIASIFGGMSLSFSSIIINELSSERSKVYHQDSIDTDGTTASFIGVSD